MLLGFPAGVVLVLGKLLSVRSSPDDSLLGHAQAMAKMALASSDTSRDALPRPNLLSRPLQLFLHATLALCDVVLIPIYQVSPLYTK